MHSRIALCLLFTIVLSGCAILREPQDPSILPVAPVWQENQKWWKAFDDPLMNEYAEAILSQSLDIKMAQARLLAARATRDSSRAAFFPELSTSGSIARGNSNSPTPQTFGQTGLDLNWDVDIFGRTRAKVSADEADIKSSEASVAEMRNSIVAELIRSVIGWRQAQQTIKETNDLLKAQDDEVKLLGSRASAGLIDASFYERARAQREQTATQLPQAKAAANAAQHTMARLLDRDDDVVEKKLRSIAPLVLSLPSPAVMEKISVATLNSRPDIAIAAAQLEKAGANVQEAKANFWPRLSVSAFFGVQDGTRGLRLADNPIWSLASNMTAPLLNFGRLEGALDAANARHVESMLRYKDTVNRALEETRTALSDYLHTVNAANKQQQALNHRQETVRIARARFTKGLTDMTDLTTAQSELDQATLSLITLKSTAAIAYVRLQKALGLAVLD